MAERASSAQPNQKVDGAEKLLAYLFEKRIVELSPGVDRAVVVRALRHALNATPKVDTAQRTLRVLFEDHCFDEVYLEEEALLELCCASS